MPIENFKVGEMLNKRSPNSKTWINFDGSYTTEIFQGPVHFQDDSGNFHNINTDLFDEADLDDFDFPVNREGKEVFKAAKEMARQLKKQDKMNRDERDFQGLQVPFLCKIPRNFKRGYSIGKGNDKLKFKPVGSSPSKGYINGKANEITYSDAWNDADVSLEVLPTGIKETIILKTDRAPSSFSFEVEGPLEDILRAGTMKLEPAWLQDANGEKRDVLQKVRREGEQTFIDLVADVTGLVYPIEIDPTVTIQPDGTAGKDTMVYGAPTGTTTNYGNATSMNVGGGGGSNTYHRSLISFDVSSIPANSQLSSAVISFTQSSSYDSTSRTFNIHKITSSWVESAVTWDTQPPFDPAVYGTWTGGSNGNTYNTTNLSTLFQEWVNGTANNGLLIKEGSETLGTYKGIYTSDESVIANRPKLTVTYNQPPTAPVVTAPNGGETWNASHTVTWNAAVDSDFRKTTNSNTSLSPNTSTVYGQTYTVVNTGQIKSVSYFMSTTDKAFGACTFNIKNVSGNVAGTTTHYTKNYASISSTNKILKFVLDTPISVIAGQQIAIEFNFTGGTTTNFEFNNANGYSGGNAYTGAVADTGWDWVIEVEETTSNLQYQIQVSTNNGGAWSDIVSLTTAGATSYTYDFTPVAETSTALVRIRAYDGSAYGPWDQSNGVFTIVHNQAPTAPTGLSPSGIPKDRATVIRFAWLHNDPNNGDPQSKFDLQWRLQGAGTWNTVTQSVTNNYYDMPANTLPKGTIEWQVRTYDQAGLSSPYSALTVFTAGDKPATPIFVTPADNSTVSVSRPTVQWSSVDQVAYEVKVLDSTGASTLWTTGQVTSTNKAVTVGMDLQNSTGYDIQVLIKNADGLWSTAALSNITVSYTPPALPIVIVSTDSARGSITLSIDNPVPTGTEPSPTTNDIYRKKSSEATYKRIKTGVLADGSFTDFTAAGGESYQYYVRVSGDNGTYSDSVIASSSVTITNAQLALTTDYSQYFEVIHAAERGETVDNDMSLSEFAGRTNLLAEFGEHELTDMELSCIVFNTTDLNKLRTLSSSKQTLLYRDNTGRKMFCVMGNLKISDKKPSYFEVSFPIHKVYYDEVV